MQELIITAMSSLSICCPARSRRRRRCASPGASDRRAVASVRTQSRLRTRKQYTAGDAGAEVVTLDRKRVGTLLAWGQLAEGRGETSLHPTGSILFCVRNYSRLPGENLQTVLSRVHQRNVTSGETVVREGQPGEEYFLILEGEFSVSRDTESGLPLLRPI